MAAARIIIGVSLLILLLLWNDNGRKLLTVLSGFEAVHLAWLVAIFTALNGVSSIKWGLFLHERGVKISLPRLFSLYLIGKFFNNFLPSMVGGDVARIYLLGQQIRSHSLATASVFLERATGVVGLALLGGVMAAINFEMLAQPAVAVPLAATVLGCLVAVLLFYLSPFTSVATSLVAAVPVVNVAAPKLEKLLSDIEYFRYRNQVLLRSLFYSVIVHVLTACNVYVACLSIGFEPSFLDILVVTPVILILTTIPVSPNNIGWWEWCFSVFLTGAGATPAEGLAVALILRAVGMAMSLAGGVLLVVSRRPA